MKPLSMSAEHGLVRPSEAISGLGGLTSNFLIEHCSLSGLVTLH